MDELIDRMTSIPLKQNDNNNNLNKQTKTANTKCSEGNKAQDLQVVKDTSTSSIKN